MPIKIGIYNFDGQYTNTNSLKDKSGVYVILCEKNKEYSVIDIGESANVKTRIESHDRADCWSKECNGNLAAAVLYTPNSGQAGRREIEQKLREEYNPSCGKR
ncbi:MAG: hypothetical protein DRI23_05640 [Candidatus Cloacimonadota bacterium]|nr:MAG: hypothetical protein DRI23_05640 [Candidatus Cloacimonadota bacterium]